MQFAPISEQWDHYHRRGQGEAEAEHQACLPAGKSPPDIKADHKGAEHDLRQAKSEHVAAEAAKLVKPDFETDQKQQQNNAELGDAVQRLDSRGRYVSHQLNQDASHEKGDDRANPKPAEDKQTHRYQS